MFSRLIERIFVAIVLASLVACASGPKQKSLISDGINTETRQRVEAWKSLIENGTSKSDIDKLNSANEFVNEIEFVDDIYHWKKQDYWATPLQTLVTEAGDCEDLSIAKYFTLTAMGLDENKLRLTYVKALTINKAHMVVSYFAEPNSEPLVLDNLNKAILPASQRQDLLPVYSFNGEGLWLAKREEGGRYAGTSDRMGLWQGLLQSMDAEASNEAAMICLYQYYDLADEKAKTFCP
ncbi:MAG: transglutaminase-like cysteine peptidase [Cycloclasticus sp.]|nr:transglutaminase-like cysteine peptidase [Cycloclasticus sp.]